VVTEAGNQAKDLLGRARTELTEQAGAQHRLAAGLHALARMHRTELPFSIVDLGSS
jgi:hypothetical protein